MESKTVKVDLDLAVRLGLGLSPHATEPAARSVSLICNTSALTARCNPLRILICSFMLAAIRDALRNPSGYHYDAAICDAMHSSGEKPS